jgi:hypothetical protein
MPNASKTHVGIGIRLDRQRSLSEKTSVNLCDFHKLAEKILILTNKPPRQINAEGALFRAFARSVTN